MCVPIPHTGDIEEYSPKSYMIRVLTINKGYICLCGLFIFVVKSLSEHDQRQADLGLKPIKIRLQIFFCYQKKPLKRGFYKL